MVDIRVVKTKENIVTAFFSLLDIEKYRDITVEQICQYARCSRSTFYSHYNSKESVLKEIIDDYMSQFDSYAKKRFKENTVFSNLLAEIMNKLIIPEKKKLGKLLQIELENLSLTNRFEIFYKEIFLVHYPDIPSKNIISELYGACVVKILKAIIEDRLEENDIRVINELQKDLLKASVFKEY
ncbi:AcrR family transcriptional regulator [Bacillus sp. J14TS2]|nr:AcrR family transcriptional regulator [Bacillus sp. J14TS2]